MVIYLPMRLIFDASSWLVPGHYPLPIQTSRILLYAGYFCVGVAVGEVGESGCWEKMGRWRSAGTYGSPLQSSPMAQSGYGLHHHSGLIDFNSPPLW